jgi:hypothetical protein
MTWEIILNRANDFCLQEIQVTSFPALSKQSRKKGSLHSICEAAEMLEMTMTLTEMLEIPMTLTCILMDSAEDPTFFKNPSIPWAGHTKHCTEGHSFWISTKAPLHAPSIHTTKTLTLGESPP